MKKFLVSLAVSMVASVATFAQYCTGTSTTSRTDMFGNTVTTHRDAYGHTTKEVFIWPLRGHTKTSLVWFNDYSSDQVISNAFENFLYIYKRKYGDYEKDLQGDTYVYKFDAGTGIIGLYMQPKSFGQMSGCFFRYSDAINCSMAIDEIGDGI